MESKCQHLNGKLPDSKAQCICESKLCDQYGMYECDNISQTKLTRQFKPCHVTSDSSVKMIT